MQDVREGLEFKPRTKLLGDITALNSVEIFGKPQDQRNNLPRHENEKLNRKVIEDKYPAIVGHAILDV